MVPCQLNTRRRLIGLPLYCIALEVWVFKNLHALENDANFWIAKSVGQTKVVILIIVGKTKKTTIVEQCGSYTSAYQVCQVR